VAPRAIWKGYLKVGELVCPVALHTAVSASERVALHMLNRKTGHRLQRQFVDRETGKEVERDEQVKGYEVGPDDYVILEPDEIATAIPESDKTLAVDSFIPCDQVDDLYFDRPYYLSPSGAGADKAYAVLREGLRKKKVVALASAILFRRVRTLLIRACDQGLVATTLNFDYEVRSAAEAFDGVPAIKIKKDMLDLARHIIETKKGTFDPTTFDDKYEAALVDLVHAKMEGREIKVPKAPPRGKVIDLMEALRQSAGAGKAKTGTKTAVKKTATKKAAQKKTSQRKTAQRKTAQRKAS
jgi:DNA end-binding protein Ku